MPTDDPPAAGEAPASSTRNDQPARQVDGASSSDHGPPAAAELLDGTSLLAARADGAARRDAVREKRERLLRSGLFDGDWYRRHHPAAAASDLSPLDHYLAYGIAAHASPGPLFDTPTYLRALWYVEAGLDDPLEHYLLHGQHEARAIPGVAIGRPPTGADGLGRRSEPTLLLPTLSRQPSLAVMLHAFHVDLVPEALRLLAAIPYRFTLFVSTDTEEKAAFIRDVASRAAFDALLLVHVGPNRGRNFGPMLLRFAQPILDHEILLHLHTKKSMHSGVEQAEWRDILWRTLLPCRTAVNGLIERFVRDDRLGVLMPSPGEGLRHWSFHWLSSRAAGAEWARRLGIADPGGGAIDYPAGGMFWARTRAIRRLLDHPWQVEDFPPERGQTDGTVMHAIERLVIAAARTDGFGFSEIDYEHGLMRLGWSDRLFGQYGRVTHDGLLDTILWADTVSFDLFDTLITRVSLSPDAVQEFVGEVVRARYPLARDFLFWRRRAEAAARTADPGLGDVDLDEIARAFRALEAPGWDDEAIGFAREQEALIDRRTLRPRERVVEALRFAREQGRRVMVTSDSYLPRADFDRVLEACGLSGLIDEVFLSSEQRARKDDGRAWTMLRARPDLGRLLHVGDNEQSDIQMTADAGIRHFHLLPPRTLFAQAGLLPDAPLGFADEILLGPLAATLFNEPYLQAPRLQGTLPGPVRLLDAEEAGAVLFGPLLLAFLAAIARHPATPHLRRLFFASREGFFLHRLYDVLHDRGALPGLPPASYLHVSRRSTLAALQGLGLDAGALLAGAGYRGTVTGFLEARIGFTPDPSLRHHEATIRLPRDDDTMRCVLDLLREPIEAHGREALDALRRHAAGIGLGLGLGRDEPAGFVDVGYSGTIQNALQRALGRPLIGFYMGVSEAAAQLRAGGGHAFGFFADGNVADFTGGYGLMIEAFLTAPHGQVLGYDGPDAVPRFGPHGQAQQGFAVLERMYAGVERYALELLDAYGPCLMRLPFQPHAATAMLEAFRRRRLVLDPALTAVLSVEDDFCGNGEIPVFAGIAGNA
ncbi:rhamnan synthesis F family protein [Rhizosaccharibacter radicis]|uniref:Glycosyl transferase family 1 n=1 Tax=Rhizosaccharibacter radicis TaxID=2782605 RepID=A0ABT1VZC8_9PROT|nr:hypothetical protein [Acetobacteraceae bacterium KSS12]